MKGGAKFFGAECLEAIFVMSSAFENPIFPLEVAQDSRRTKLLRDR